ncbi:MAG: flagellar basal body rod protein FlgB [Fimbriimonadaceae bacterium]|nr:flagellar basal body rod protein FlgB [Alphaproteobacteria bacterium]
MATTGLNVLSALKTKMLWHQGRQNLLAENIANADTPGFRARDLNAPDFADLLNRSSAAMIGPGPAQHSFLTNTSQSTQPDFQQTDGTDWEVTPEGNAVVLEEQMMKVAENQMDYQMATTLYSRSLGLLRTAIGRR